MKIKNIIINIAIGALVILILFIGYQVVFSGPGEEESLSTGLAPQGFASRSEASAKAAEFLDVLESVRGIEFDTTVFTRPAFESLEDFSVTLIAKPKGRINPFAPIGVGNITFGEDGSAEGESDDGTSTSTSTDEDPLGGNDGI